MAPEKKKRRRKSKALTTAAAGTAAGGRQTEVSAMWEGGDMREVARVVDPIDLMYRKGTIDPREYQAACSYRECVELMFSGYRCALDPTIVGGSSSPKSPSDAQVFAAERVHQVAKLLGMIDGAVVMMVAGEGMTLREVTDKMMGSASTEREVLATGARLRQSLRLLADTWYPLRERSPIEAFRRFDPSSLDTKLAEVVRGNFAHATLTRVWTNN